MGPHPIKPKDISLYELGIASFEALLFHHVNYCLLLLGLFKSDFISLEEHTAFVWANPVPSRWSHPSVQLSDDNTDGQSQSRVRSGEPYFSVQFTDQSLLISDKFRLVYVSQSGDVLGMSDPFLVRH